MQLYSLADEVSTSVVVKDWLVELYAELDKEGLSVPERMTDRGRASLSSLMVTLQCFYHRLRRLLVGGRNMVFVL
ncbi:hypothetical protein L1987_18071 [Smallanthus sonchifolius]|uniref:Uncharacterized protein n=1 Tax=Smallanthus sonchifolius TaxID=185202 RepID=A0ACB9J193_9ASTR|nr:hypothetical protein L1987_18071 [Smallanthus sonchifolius]